MTDITALIEQIEALEGPDGEVDAEIFKAIGAPLPEAAFGMGVELHPDPNSASGFVMPIGELQVRYECPAYTASLDAAMTLVPEGASWDLRWWSGDRKCWVTFYPPGDDEDDYFHIHGIATPALALCAAALRSRIDE